MYQFKVKIKFPIPGTCKSYLKVNDQTRLAQLGFKTKGVKLFSDDERTLEKENGKNTNTVIRSLTLQETTKKLLSILTSSRKHEPNQGQFRRF